MQINRLLISGTGRTFVQEEKGKDVHTQYGVIRADDIESAKDGDVVESAKGERLVVLSPAWIDRYKKIGRNAQIVTFKDAGVILATAGLGPDTVVAEAGSGSGALTCFLARHCKHVYSYDVEKEHLALAQQNTQDLGLDNVTFRRHDVSDGLPDGDLDCLVLDLPEPWTAFEHVPDALRVGGYVVTYVPSTVQLQQVRNAGRECGFLHVRSVEVSERHWMVKEDAVRPTSRNVAFTAFLTFYRYLGPHWPDLRPPEKQSSDGPKLPSEEQMRAAF